MVVAAAAAAGAGASREDSWRASRPHLDDDEDDDGDDGVIDSIGDFLHDLTSLMPGSASASCLDAPKPASAIVKSSIPDSPSMRRLEKDLASEAEHTARLQSLLTDEASHWLVEHLFFKGFITVAVLINAILMGVEVDHPEWKDEWKRIDHVFGGLFFLEMLIKLAALRRDYFRDRWNWLDCALANMGFMDTWFVTIVGGSNLGLSQFSILRILRLLRLVRLARLFKQFSKLVIVMRSIKDAIETTFWVASVLVICIYVCAIFCVDFIGRAEDTYPGFSSDEAVIDEQEVMQNFNPHLVFGSMATAMCSLFNIAILAEWTEIVRPVLLKQPVLVVFFIAFMCFVCFGVMNVIIGMIVDSVIQNARALEREVEQAHKREKVLILAQLKDAIFTVDTTGDCEIDMDELEILLNTEDDRLKNIMDKVSLPYGCSSNEFLALLDNDGNGKLKHDEFVQTLYRLINCSGFQQTCLIQIGVNKLMLSINNLARAVEDIPQQIRQRSSPSARSALASPSASKTGSSPSAAKMGSSPSAAKMGTPVYSVETRRSEAVNQANAALTKDASAVRERPELGIRLDAVCREVSRAVCQEVSRAVTQEVSRTVHHKLREELTQTLEKVLVAQPKAGHPDEVRLTGQEACSEARLIGQWQQLEAIEDELRTLAVDAARQKISDRPPSKDDVGAAGDRLRKDVAHVLGAGQPSSVADTYPFNAPAGLDPLDAKALGTSRVDSTDDAIDKKSPSISATQNAASPEEAAKIQLESFD